MIIDNAPRRASGLAVLAVIAAAACIIVPAWQLIVPGPFDWHIKQPFTWQGGLEAMVLIGLVATGCTVARRWALLALVALPIAFYLRRHSVDVSLLIDLVYLEIIIGLGALMRRVFRLSPPQDAHSYLQAFVLGFLAWSVLAWGASALDVGSIKALRWLTLLLVIPAVGARHTPFALYLWRGLGVQTAMDRFWCGALAAWVAVLYARSNVVFGYDSLWYGLRGEYVLDPGNSLYQPLGLVAPVHYYPKLYEIFLLPVSALGDTSVIVGMTIWMLVLVVLACHMLATRIGLPARARMPVLALIATLPALANSALEPKPDVISVLFVLLAADAAIAWTHSRAIANAAWMLTAGMLACLAKLTAVPFVGVLVLAAALTTWRDHSDGDRCAPDEHATRLAVAAFVAALAVAAFVTARTWLLSGVPTILPMRVWQALGMTLAAPAGTLDWAHAADWADTPALIIDWLFRPQRLAHVVIAWVGNVWLWFGLLAFAAAVQLRRPAPDALYTRLPLAALMATGAALAVGINNGVRGSDGNYFLAALLPAILVSATAAFRRLALAPRAFAVALACLPAFVLFQASYSFVSAGWWPGTRTFDMDLTRTWHDTRRLRWDKLEYAGLGRIGAYLREVPGKPRAVGYAAEPASFWLPARFEYLLSISYWRPEYVDDPRRFLRFMRDQHIDCLILPKASAPAQVALVTPAVKAAAQSLSADPDVRRVEDRDYLLLDLSARHQRELAGEAASKSPHASFTSLR